MALISKQTSAEMDENFSKVSKALLPAVLSITDANFTIISNYMFQRHLGTDGLVDVSVQNLSRAISACVNALSWTVPPKPKAQTPPKAKPDAQGLVDMYSRGNHAKRQQESFEREAFETRTWAAIAKEADNNRVQETLALCEEFIASGRTSRNTHSRTARLRDALREIYDKGRSPEMTPEKAEALYSKLVQVSDATA